MSQRIYRVINAETAAEHLVRASSQAQAIRHVVKETYRAAVAGQETIVELLTSGVKVQDAGAELQLDIDDGHDGSEA
jgi:peptidoglycan hydrolase-like amidase